MRVAHLLDVLDQLMGQLAVAQPAGGVVAGAPPTAQVDLVERERLVRASWSRGGGPSSRRRASGSGPGRPPSRRSAAAPRRRTRTGRTSRTPGRGGGSGTCRASLRPDPGTNSSQKPLGMCFRIGWRRPSQALKSPTTLTLVALGAQTAKFTPSTPSIVRKLGAQLVVALPVRAPR